MIRRPHDPDVIYAALQKHRSRCGGCANGGQCPYAEQLLLAWGESETFFATEQAVIDAALQGESHG